MIVGNVLRGFDKIFVLFRSVRKVSVVMFCVMAIGILVNNITTKKIIFCFADFIIFSESYCNKKT